MPDNSKYSDIGRRQYNLFAPLYDPLLSLLEGSNFAEWRKLLWSKVEGKNILEVGVGTGRSFPFYPPGATILAIDNSENMLRRAKHKAEKLNLWVNLELMDVQRLAFSDNTFDSGVSSLVFCSVPDPIQGLKEVRRVVRSGGKVVLLEHVISDKPSLARFINLLNSPIAALTGENFNRDTAYNVEKSGLIVEKVTRLSSIFRLIEARKERLYFLK